jgi:ketosteroid isomerase-like protein
MSPSSEAARAIARFREYAAAFEAAYASDDWSVLTSFFTADATSRLNGATVEGRDAVLASFRDGVAMFDRRFDARSLRITDGPTFADGRLFVRITAHYERAGVPALDLVGDEWFTFDGDRIAVHVDEVVNGAEVMSYLAEHAAALRPFGANAEPTPPARRPAVAADERRS